MGQVKRRVPLDSPFHLFKSLLEKVEVTDTVTLDFRSNNLPDPFLTKFFDLFMEKNKTIRELNLFLSQNNFSSSGTAYMLSILQNYDNLTVFVLDIKLYFN